jgi:hypothetical protein
LGCGAARSLSFLSRPLSNPWRRASRAIFLQSHRG